MIELVHQDNDAKSIVILIHGFIGGKTTWVKKKGNKPLIDPLLKDPIISDSYDFAIFIYHSELLKIFPKTRSFFSKFFQKKKTTKNSPIEDIAKILGTSIKYNCSNYDNIVLIAHSMGGLVAKRFVLDDIKENDNSKVKLYISLATPHSGSDLARFGSKIIENSQIKNMAPLSNNIRQLNEEWVKCDNLPLRFYGQGLSDIIVPKESSIALDRDKQNVFYSNDDHFSIIIPDNDNDNILLALKTELKAFIGKINIGSIDKDDLEEKISELTNAYLVSVDEISLRKLQFEVMKLRMLVEDNFELIELEKKINKAIIFAAQERDKLIRQENKFLFLEEKIGYDHSYSKPVNIERGRGKRKLYKMIILILILITIYRLFKLIMLIIYLHD